MLLAGRVSAPEARLDATPRRLDRSTASSRSTTIIEVAETSGWLDRPQDFIMRQALVAKILGDSSIREVNYTTDVVHGVVYLMGVGQNQDEVDRVVAHANSLNNVKRVENYVVLKDDPIREGCNVTSAE